MPPYQKVQPPVEISAPGAHLFCFCNQARIQLKVETEFGNPLVILVRPQHFIDPKMEHLDDENGLAINVAEGVQRLIDGCYQPVVRFNASPAYVLETIGTKQVISALLHMTMKACTKARPVVHKPVPAAHPPPRRSDHVLNYNDRQRNCGAANSNDWNYNSGDK